MKVNIKNILKFFDETVDYHKGDVNAVVAVLGEDLNAAVFRYCRRNKVDVLNDSVTQGFQGGKYLDRWIVDKKTKILWQCEIKNWSATAIGGRMLDLGAGSDKIKEVVKYYWDREFGKGGNLSRKSKHPNGVTKVLLQMIKPVGCENYKVKPLLIYWMPISKDFTSFNPLSDVSIKKLGLPLQTKFSKLCIFSVSLFLRQLYKQGKFSIDLDMPSFQRRIKILNSLKN